jgi:hypothetical protein
MAIQLVVHCHFTVPDTTGDQVFESVQGLAIGSDRGEVSHHADT